MPSRGAGSACTDFLPGAYVRIVGLTRTEFNHHVGEVTAEAAPEGRVAVRVHGSVWPTNPGRGGCPEKTHQSLAVQCDNLRRLPVRPSARPARVCSLGCVLPAMATALLDQRGRGFSDDLARRIVDFLCLQRVSPQDIQVSGCSSNRGDFPLADALSEDDRRWWISASGSMPGGIGREFLEFHFGDLPRRVEYVGVKIPALPHGPLSVRVFHLLALLPWRSRSDPTAWQPVGTHLAKAKDFVSEDVHMHGSDEDEIDGHQFVTLDLADLQEFALDPPLETTAVRLVCTRNAAAGCSSSCLIDCVGLFRVRFS